MYGVNLYLVYYPDDIGRWQFQDDETFCFLKPEEDTGGIFHLQTKGKEMFYFVWFCESHVIQDFILENNPLNLDYIWKAASEDGKWSDYARIKIFSDEKKFDDFQKILKMDLEKRIYLHE